MRWTKIALLTFGAGLLLGLTVVVAEIGWLERPASFLMALAIAGLPLGMAVDWRRATKAPRPPAKKRAKSRPRRAADTMRPPRKSAPRKR